jgi:hypothetical protein
MSPAGLETNRHFARIAEEAAGSPFFVGELTRYLTALGAGPEVAAPTLQEVVRARVGRLGDTQRTLLELVAVAGGPIDGAVILDAAGGARLRPVLLDLEEQSLVRSTATTGRVVLEMYHDRLRETVTALAPAPAIAARHAQIAAALERTIAPDPRELLAHYEGAGDRDGARRFALAAADAANEALAFRPAANLYRRALELGVDDETRSARGSRRCSSMPASGMTPGARSRSSRAGALPRTRRPRRSPGCAGEPRSNSSSTDISPRGWESFASSWRRSACRCRARTSAPWYGFCASGVVCFGAGSSSLRGTRRRSAGAPRARLRHAQQGVESARDVGSDRRGRDREPITRGCSTRAIATWRCGSSARWRTARP